jgi:hypothetical protein
MFGIAIFLLGVFTKSLEPHEMYKMMKNQKFESTESGN